ncbi:ribonuclease H-like domain-containing protein [Tanacetum coccineum]|uniref:Ribonuclease H-like domain-containing protein n=1 Tax=Tanacetum coccineum TaxID=301880 RepID=A0ABQ5J705_9ASTR
MEDLEDLYKLVKARYGSTRPVEDLNLVLWNDLKTTFEPHVEDEIWKLQQRKEISPYTTYNYRFVEQEASGSEKIKVKARSTLMMGIPNENQLKFNYIKDVKLLLEAIEKRFGGNAATKKTQRNLLKQQHENFNALSSEMLDQTFDRLQKLVSQLELLDEKLSQEDVNQKLLRSLSPEWNTHAVVWRNKAKVKCYNCHKRGHFAREYRALRNQDNKNKESSRRSVPVETSTSTALVSCDGLGGYDWSDQAEEGPNYALMAYSSSSSDIKLSNDSNCSKFCMETVKLLKSQNDQLLRDLEKSSLMVLGYKTGLESVEEKLEFYKKNESVYVENINGLK